MVADRNALQRQVMSITAAHEAETRQLHAEKAGLQVRHPHRTSAGALPCATQAAAQCQTPCLRTPRLELCRLLNTLRRSRPSRCGGEQSQHGGDAEVFDAWLGACRWPCRRRRRGRRACACA